MVQLHSRLWGALIAAVVLALPLSAAAQSQPHNPKAEASKEAPVTAPTRNAGNVPVAPQVDPPKPGAGSTAAPGWNNPPESWDAWSERPQYASVPGRETNRLIQGSGREW